MNFSPITNHIRFVTCILTVNNFVKVNLGRANFVVQDLDIVYLSDTYIYSTILPDDDDDNLEIR